MGYCKVRLLVCVAIYALTAAGANLPARAGDIRVVARTGDSLPGGGSLDRHPSFVSINELGEVSFSGDVRAPGSFNSRSAAIVERNGELEILVVEGQASPPVNDGPDAAYDGVYGLGPHVGFTNAVGDSALGVALTQLSGPGRGYVRFSNGAPAQRLARNGGLALGAGMGSTYRGFLNYIDGPRLNDHGTIVYNAPVEVTGSSNALTRGGIFAAVSGEPATAIVLGGADVADRPGVRLGGLGSVIDLSLNDDDTVAFAAVVSTLDPLYGRVDSNGVFRALLDGSVSTVATALDPLPGGPTGVRFGPIFRGVSQNDVGAVAFGATIGVPTMSRPAGGGSLAPDVFSVTTPAILTESRGVYEVVASGGDPVPGQPGVIYDSLSDPAINNSHDVAFRGVLSGEGVSGANEVALFVADEDGIRTIVRLGDPAPGAPGNAAFIDIGAYTLNANGQVAFVGEVDLGAIGRRGVWAADTDGELQLIALEGTTLIDFEQDPSVVDERVLSHINSSLLSGGISTTDSQRVFFNDSGQVAIGASEGFAGVAFVSNRVAIPEPSAAGMMLLLVGGSVGRRRGLR